MCMVFPFMVIIPQVNIILDMGINKNTLLEQEHYLFYLTVNP